MIKTRLDGAKGIWPDKLPGVLWAYRIMVHTPTGKTPFRLAYGHEAVIPVKVGLIGYRVSHHDEGRNEEGMRLQLDLLDKVKATTKQRMAHYQDLMAKYYKTKVKPCHFQVRDLVLRKVTTTTKDPSQGKLGPNWEGPYKIANCHRKGTYYLETLDE